MKTISIKITPKIVKKAESFLRNILSQPFRFIMSPTPKESDNDYKLPKKFIKNVYKWHEQIR